MEQYLMGKLGWERSNSPAMMRTHLQQDPALGASWDDIWVACEMQRYGASQGNLDALAAQPSPGRKPPNPRCHEAPVPFLFLLFLALVHSAYGQPEAAFEAANAAYEAGEYDDALTRYEALLETHRHFESNSMRAMPRSSWVRGCARLHYERAKLLDPSNEHLQANLALLESTVDRITAILLGLTSGFPPGWGRAGSQDGCVGPCLRSLSGALDGAGAKTSQDSRKTIGFLAFASLLLGLIGLGCVRESNARIIRPTIGCHVNGSM